MCGRWGSETRKNRERKSIYLEALSYVVAIGDQYLSDDSEAVTMMRGGWFAQSWAQKLTLLVAGLCVGSWSLVRRATLWQPTLMEKCWLGSRRRL